MPLFMDIHIVPGVKARDVADAHRLDMLCQSHHHCNCMTYWIDEARESIFCLIEAPEKTAVEEMHREAHGLVPHKVIEVDSTLVESFLGRIYDPESATTSADGLKVFHEPSYRVILLAQTTDTVLLRHRLGIAEANEMFRNFHDVIRKNILKGEGREVEHPGKGFIASFLSVGQAIAAAAATRQELSGDQFVPLDLHLALDGGEPVGKSSQLFGDTIRFAKYLCRIAKNTELGLSSAIKGLGEKDLVQYPASLFMTLSSQDEDLLRQLFGELEGHWTDPDFDLEEYCKSTALSRSRLYRKCIQLTGSSPNQLLKDYRLERSLDLLRDQRNSIAQVTFETGFTSPSYFTKCFKERFGLLPLAYSKMD